MIVSVLRGCYGISYQHGINQITGSPRYKTTYYKITNQFLIDFLRVEFEKLFFMCFYFCFAACLRVKRICVAWMGGRDVIMCTTTNVLTDSSNWHLETWTKSSLFMSFRFTPQYASRAHLFVCCKHSAATLQRFSIETSRRKNIFVLEHCLSPKQMSAELY